jgi:hypothetical protein
MYMLVKDVVAVVLLSRGEHEQRGGVQVLHRQLHQAGLPVCGWNAAGALLPAGGGGVRCGLDAMRGCHPVLPQPDCRPGTGAINLICSYY